MILSKDTISGNNQNNFKTASPHQSHWIL